jgi:alkylation response protein AidB-like acyl-CoA dehydrogenase
VNFAFDEDQELLRATVRRFVEQRHPLGALRPLIEADEVVNPDVWRAGAELGFTAMLVPAEHGGGSVTNQPLVDLVVIAEELGRVLYPGPFVPTNVVADALVQFGSDGQRKEHLPGLAGGDVIAAWCLTGDGSTEPESVDVVATVEGEHVRLTGVAAYVHGGSTADVLLVAARSEAGLVHLLIPAATDGITVRNITGLDLTRRFAEVTFTDVVVPASTVVGTAGVEGEALLARALDVATVLQAAETVGAAEHLFGATVQYAKDRVQFGRPIGSFQAIKHRLADLLISVEAMRAATHYAALALGDDLPDRDEAVAVAGSYVTDAHAHLGGEALQLHGGIGFTWEHDAHLFIRRAKVDQVLYGEAELHRERLCRLLERATPEAG